MTLEPYIGPRPFARGEDDRFFGRGGETRRLVSMVLSNRVVLLYALSGAGKTSLLNAAVVPALEQEEYFDVLPTARVRAPGTAAGNPFVEAVLSFWPGEGSTLAQRLASRPHEDGPDGFPRPRMVIVDQLEEVFTAYPEHWGERGGLFRELTAALREDPLLRVILAIREDYLAQLEPYRELLPDRLEASLRLELLRADAAQEAVAGPLAATDRRFADGAAEELVSDLRRSTVTGETGERQEFRGEYVEPVQLQLACTALWRDLPPGLDVITVQHLKRFGDVDQVLREFYDESIAAAARAAAIDESQLRRSLADTFVTSMQTRGTAYRSGELVGSVPVAAVEELEQRHVVRAEYRAHARWYELTHDRLIEPIVRSNAIALRRAASDLATAARGTIGALVGVLVAVLPTNWLGSVVEDNLLWSFEYAVFLGVLTAGMLAGGALGSGLAAGLPRLRRRTALALALGAALGAGAGWLDGLLPYGAVAFMTEFALVGCGIGLSGLVAPRRRLSAVAGAVAGAGAAGLGTAGVFADIQILTILLVYAPIVVSPWLPDLVRASWRAGGETELRAPRRRRAVIVGTAIAATLVAGVVMTILVQADTAREQSAVASSQSLAAQSAVQANRELAALLAVSAYDVSPTQESVRAMRAALTNLKAFRAGSEVAGLSVTPDGRKLATIGAGRVRLWEVETGRELASGAASPAATDIAFNPSGRSLAFPATRDSIALVDTSTFRRKGRLTSPTVGALTTLAFGRSGIAAGNSRGGLTLWATPSSEPSLLVRRLAAVSALAFRRDGRRLAAGYDDGVVREVDVPTGILRASVARRGDVGSLDYSPDGRMLAVAGANGTIEVRVDGRRTMPLSGHSGAVTGVAFNLSGMRLASAGNDGTVRIWDMRTFRRLGRPITGLGGAVLALEWNPGGGVVTGDADGRVRLLDLVLATGDPYDLERAICAEVGHGLTRAEAAEYLPAGTSTAGC